MSTVMIEIDQIKPNDYNPNVMSERDYKALRQGIIVTNGEYLIDQPIIIRHTEEGDIPWEIIDGEHRWRACKELGFATVPCEIKTKSRIEAQIYNVISNKNRGHLDYDKLAEIFWEHWKGFKEHSFQINGQIVKPSGKLTHEQIGQKFTFSAETVREALMLKTSLSSELRKTHIYMGLSNFDKVQLARVKNHRLQKLLLSDCFNKKGERILGSKQLSKEATVYNNIWKMISGYFSNPDDQNEIIDWIVTENIHDETKIKNKIATKLNEKDMLTKALNIPQTPSTPIISESKPTQQTIAGATEVTDKEVEPIIDQQKILAQHVINKQELYNHVVKQELVINQELKRLLSEDEYLTLLQWANDEGISLLDLILLALRNLLMNRDKPKIM